MAAAPKAQLHPHAAVGLRTIIHHVDANVAGRFSWRRLVEILREAGELRKGEEVESFVIDDEGIQFYVRRTG